MPLRELVASVMATFFFVGLPAAADLGEEPPKEMAARPPYLVQRESLGFSPRAMAFLPDNQTLAVVGHSGVLEQWDALKGKRISRTEKQKESSGFFECVAVSPDGKLAAAGDYNGKIFVFDLERNKCLNVLNKHKIEVNALFFVADGKKLLSGSYDGTVREWTLKDSSQRLAFKHSDLIRFVYETAYSERTGHLVAIGPDREWVMKIDLAADTAKTDFATVRESAYSPVISPDGKYVAVGTQSAQIALFDMDNGKRTHFFGPAPDKDPPRGVAAISHLAYTPNGSRLLAGDSFGNVQLFDVDTKRLVRSFKGHQQRHSIRAMAVSPDGRLAATADKEHNLCVWDIATGLDFLRCEGHAGRVNGVCFHEKRNWIVSAGQDKSARLWDAANGKELQSFAEHKGKVSTAMFVGDGEQVLTAGHDALLRLWDARSGEVLREFEGHAEAIHCAAVSKDGKFVASGAGRLDLEQEPTPRLVGRDCTVRVWDAASGKELRRLEGHTGPVIGVAFLRDATQLLTAGEDQTVRRWDVETGEELERMDKHAGEITAFALSPDESNAVSVDLFGSVLTWDLKRGVAIQDFDKEHPLLGKVKDHPRKRVLIRGLAFSPDGKQLIFGVEGGAIIRDAVTGNRLDEVTGVEARTYGVAFGPDGKSVFTGGSDHLVRRWLLTAK